MDGRIFFKVQTILHAALMLDVLYSYPGINLWRTSALLTAIGVTQWLTDVFLTRQLEAVEAKRSRIDGGRSPSGSSSSAKPSESISKLFSRLNPRFVHSTDRQSRPKASRNKEQPTPAVKVTPPETGISTAKSTPEGLIRPRPRAGSWLELTVAEDVLSSEDSAELSVQQENATTTTTDLFEMLDMLDEGAVGNVDLSRGHSDEKHTPRQEYLSTLPEPISLSQTVQKSNDAPSKSIIETQPLLEGISDADSPDRVPEFDNCSLQSIYVIEQAIFSLQTSIDAAWNKMKTCTDSGCLCAEVDDVPAEYTFMLALWNSKLWHEVLDVVHNQLEDIDRTFLLRSNSRIDEYSEATATKGSSYYDYGQEALPLLSKPPALYDSSHAASCLQSHKVNQVGTDPSQIIKGDQATAGQSVALEDLYKEIDLFIPRWMNLTLLNEADSGHPQLDLVSQNLTSDNHCETIKKQEHYGTHFEKLTSLEDDFAVCDIALGDSTLISGTFSDWSEDTSAPSDVEQSDEESLFRYDSDILLQSRRRCAGDAVPYDSDLLDFEVDGKTPCARQLAFDHYHDSLVGWETMDHEALKLIEDCFGLEFGSFGEDSAYESVDDQSDEHAYDKQSSILDDSAYDSGYDSKPFSCTLGTGDECSINDASAETTPCPYIWQGKCVVKEKGLSCCGEIQSGTDFDLSDLSNDGVYSSSEGGTCDFSGLVNYAPLQCTCCLI